MEPSRSTGWTNNRNVTFQVHAIHEDVPFDRATASSVNAEVEALAAWLGLEVVGL